MNDAMEPVKSRARNKLDEIMNRWDQYNAPLLRTEERAAQYASRDARDGYFFLLQGLDLGSRIDPTLTAPMSAFETISPHLRNGLDITVVDNLPAESQLAKALRPSLRQHYGALSGRFGLGGHELFVSKELAAEASKAIVIAHRIVYLLRARSQSFFTVPLFSDTSWNQIAGKENSVTIGQLGTEWSAESTLESSVVEASHFEWALSNVVHTFDLYENQRFRLAFDSLNHAAFERDKRGCISTAWVGIESLLGVEQELSYRIAMYVAILMSTVPSERTEIRSKTKKLYSLRSKAVHGSPMRDIELRQAATDSWQVLRDLLIVIIEGYDRPPTTEQLDAALLGHPIA